MFVEQMLDKARERLAVIVAAASVREAADVMAKPHTELLVVCGPDGGIVGVVTKTDILGHVCRCSGQACMASVDTIMTRQVISCVPNDLLNEVWLVIKERGLLRIPVLDSSRKPIGIVYARDAIQNLLGEAQNEEALLRDYVMTVGYR